jgi:hypothetical protein
VIPAAMAGTRMITAMMIAVIMPLPPGHGRETTEPMLLTRVRPPLETAEPQEPA